MEEGLKRLVGVTLAVVLAAALAVYVLGPAIGPSTSGVGNPPPGSDSNPPCSDRGQGHGNAVGQEKARMSGTEAADHGRGHDRGHDPDRSAADHEGKARGACGHSPEKADKADTPGRRGDA